MIPILSSPCRGDNRAGIARKRGAIGARAWSRQRNNWRPISISRRLPKPRSSSSASGSRSARCWSTGSAPTYRLPGIDPSAWEQIFRTQAGGILGMFNMFAGGGIHRMAIFALNIMPYISASIIIQLMTTVSPTLEQLKKEGEQGRKMMNQYTRYLTVVLAAFQAYGIAVGLESAGQVVTDPGLVLPHFDGDHAHRRHDVPDVARRAGDLARHRQRHFADHPGRHRRRTAVGARRHVRTRPSGRAVDRPDSGRHRDGGRGDRVHRVHGARAAPAADPVSQASGRQPHVRGTILASAAQAQHIRRHPADLRILAAAAADDGRELQRRAAARMDERRSRRSSATGVRCFLCSMSG